MVSSFFCMCVALAAGVGGGDGDIASSVIGALSQHSATAVALLLLTTSQHHSATELTLQRQCKHSKSSL